MIQFFSPDKHSMRAELLTMLHRYAEFIGFDNGERADLSVFYDRDDIPKYAETAFEWAVANEVVIGNTETIYGEVEVVPCDTSSDDSYTPIPKGDDSQEDYPMTIRRIMPKSMATRAELAVILTRFCVNFEGMSY